MSQPPSSKINLHDIITEESPPAYTPYPNSGEQSMAFGPNRPFADNNSTQNIPQRPPNNYYQVPPNQHINQPNYNVQYSNNNSVCGGNAAYSFARPTYSPTHAVIPQVITTPLHYVTNSINNFTQITRPQGNVIYVKPGDSSIGGWICPNCQGNNFI
jgi:hypothetical protein